MDEDFRIWHPWGPSISVHAPEECRSALHEQHVHEFLLASSGLAEGRFSAVLGVSGLLQGKLEYQHTI